MTEAKRSVAASEEDDPSDKLGHANLLKNYDQTICLESTEAERCSVAVRMMV